MKQHEATSYGFEVQDLGTDSIAPSVPSRPRSLARAQKVFSISASRMAYSTRPVSQQAVGLLVASDIFHASVWHNHPQMVRIGFQPRGQLLNQVLHGLLPGKSAACSDTSQFIAPGGDTSHEAPQAGEIQGPGLHEADARSEARNGGLHSLSTLPGEDCRPEQCGEGLLTSCAMLSLPMSTCRSQNYCFCFCFIGCGAMALARAWPKVLPCFVISALAPLQVLVSLHRVPFHSMCWQSLHIRRVASAAHKPTH